eukprot:scaffold6446_cov104-Isochrysis_galbana.AAC.26
MHLAQWHVRCGDPVGGVDDQQADAGENQHERLGSLGWRQQQLEPEHRLVDVMPLTGRVEHLLR